MRRIGILLIIFLLSLTLAACTGEQEDDLEAALAELEGPHTEVFVQNLDADETGNEPGENEFQPSELIIPSGTTVVWISEDTFPHSVTEGTPGETENEFDNEIPPGGYVMHIFTEPGVYTYYCKYHQAHVGQITVEAVNP